MQLRIVDASGPPDSTSSAAGGLWLRRVPGRFRRPWFLLLTLTGVALVGGCGGRDRTNPFDPLNPDTGGEPSAMVATAACARVELTWNTLDMVDLTGIRIWRMAAGRADPPGELLNQTPLNAKRTFYEDTMLVNEVLYTYTVEFLFEGGGNGFLAPVKARPGAALPWVSDPCGWGLSLLAPDGRQVRQQVAYGNPILDLDIDEENHRVFAARFDSGELLVLHSGTGASTGSLPALGASCVSWCPAIQALAVGAFYECTITWMSPQGTVFGSRHLDGHPEDVVFRDSSTTWVALHEGPLLRVSFASGEVDSMPVDLVRPVEVADDPDSGGCWVADRQGGTVAYIGDDLVIFRTAESLLGEPMGLDPTGSGTCWVADRGIGSLVALDRCCREVDRLSGMGRIADVAYDPQTGNLWVTLPEEGQVRCIVPGGEVAASIRLPGCPGNIAGDWTGGCCDSKIRTGPSVTALASGACACGNPSAAGRRRRGAGAHLGR